MPFEAPVPTNASAGRAVVQARAVGVAVFASEPAKLVTFYEKLLRVAFTHRAHDDGREHWICALGDVQLEFKALATAAGEPTADALDSATTVGTSRSEFSFSVPDVAKACAQAMVNGGRIAQRAETFGWGTFGVVIDPEGNRIGLFTPPADSTDNPVPEGQA